MMKGVEILSAQLNKISKDNSGDIAALMQMLEHYKDKVCTEDLENLNEVVQILLQVTQDDEVFIAVVLLFFNREGIIDLDEIKFDWSPGIYRLVSGTIKLDVISEINPDSVSKLDRHNESLRKMLLFLTKDIRVVFIILSHRLYLMRHLEKFEIEMQKIISLETREVFAPLANRLGIWLIKWELEDLSFSYLEPIEYKNLAKQLNKKRSEREKYIEKIKCKLSEALKQTNIEFEISGRPKHIYSIYKKMQTKRLSFDNLFDLRALRVLTATETDCYSILGVVHNLWTPIPKEFDDYISNPKPNNYRSLHTAVIADENLAVEVQIKTFEMHKFAESGVAAHWRYKENSKYNQEFEDKIKWLRELLSWKQDIDEETISKFNDELVEKLIYVLSPKGEVVELPYGSTALDFAYYIHTDLGHKTRGAKIDGKISPLTRPLKMMQQIEILSGKEIKPSRDWMDINSGYLKSSSARSKVKAWFRKQDYDDNLKLGLSILKREAKRLHVTLDMPHLVKRLKKNSEKSMLVGIGLGEISLEQVIAAFDPKLEDKNITPKINKSNKSASAIMIDGVSGLLTKMAKCCQPIEGDDIIGFITKNDGVSVHRIDCEDLSHLEVSQPERIIPITWSNTHLGVSESDILITSFARDSFLRDLTTLLANEKIPVTNLQSSLDKADCILKIKLTLEVTNLSSLSLILSKIGRISNVINVVRL